MKRLILMFVAISCLAMGFLWQSGLFASFKQSLRGKPIKIVAVETTTSGLKEPTGKSAKSPIKLKMPTKGKTEKMPMPRRPVSAAHTPKPSGPESRKPLPINLKKDRHQEKIRVDEPQSKKSGSNPSGNHGQDVAGSKPKSMPPRVVKLKGKTPPEQAPTEQILPENPTAEPASLFSGPFFGMASMSDLKASDSLEQYLKYPYTIQLGSFRSLFEAKNAVTVYREKGLSTYWSEVNIKEDEKWFRVYTGFFENREKAKKYRKEKNLLKSLVKKTPKNASVGTHHDKQGPDDKTLSNTPNLISPEDSVYDDKSPTPETTKPISVSYKGEGHQEKIRFDRLKSNASGSNRTGNHPPDVEPSMPKSMSPQAITIEGKAPAEQALAEHAQRENPSTDMASMFSGPFFGMASMSDLKQSESREEYPKYPYSIQLGSFRTLDRAKQAAESYRKKGLSAYWSEADREGDRRWFRVYTGSFESRDAARKYRKEKNLLISLVKKTPFSAFVGTYTDKQVLEDQTQLLSDLDYMPYAIREQDGKYRLFVGAFLTKKVAEEKQLALESRGIQSQIIKR